MDILGWLIGGAATLVFGCVGKLVADHFANDALPTLRGWLIRKAIFGLPVEERAAFAAHVMNEIADRRSPLAQLNVALRLIWNNRQQISFGRPFQKLTEEELQEIRIAKARAVKSMRKALFGLSVIVGSYLIVYTLNPDFLIFNQVELPDSLQGIEIPNPLPPAKPPNSYQPLEPFKPSASEFAGYIASTYKTFVGIGSFFAIVILILGGVRYILSGDLQRSPRSRIDL